MKIEEKEYIEVEVIDKSIEKENKRKKEKNKDFENLDFSGVNDLKKMILLRGLSAIIFPVLVLVLILSGLSFVFYKIFAYPWNYIVLVVFWFFIIKTIYKLIRLFKI